MITNISPSNPLVSVIITTYRRPNLLSYAIESALTQTYKNYEIYIVDDGSNDQTPTVVEKYLKHGNIHYLHNNKNMGLPAARNKGLGSSKGKYVAFLDDDDIWLPEKLRLQVNLANKLSNDYGAFYCGDRLEMDDGKIIDLIPSQRGNLMQALLKGWTPPCSSSMFLRSVLNEINGFDEKMESGIDHDIWMEIGKLGYRFDFVPQGLVKTNPHLHQMTQMTSDPINRIRGIEKFMAKWKSIFLINIGDSGFNKFHDGYLSREYFQFAKENIRTNRQSYFLTLKYLQKSIKYYPKHKRAWILFILYLFFGSQGIRIINFIRQKSFRIGNNQKHTIKIQELTIPGL